MSNNRKAVALIPARSGSKRLPSKNIRLLSGYPLLAYTIRAAIDSGVFSKVYVSTDAESIAEIACSFGAEVPFLRPAEFSGDLSPDIEWVQYTLDKLEHGGESFEMFSILRPTSPFRMPETIRRAYVQFTNYSYGHSLRAVELCKQHPGKMWKKSNGLIEPLLNDGPMNPPWHSSPYQMLPEVYVQNASLEIAWTDTVKHFGTIAGTKVIPFFTEGFEGFDINDMKDWVVAEYLINTQQAKLPEIRYVGKKERGQIK